VSFESNSFCNKEPERTHNAKVIIDLKILSSCVAIRDFRGCFVTYMKEIHAIANGSDERAAI